MARKLIHQYRFIVSEDKVVINYVYKPERILLINNITRGITIFSFNDANLTFDQINYDFDLEQTIITLKYDCSEFSDNDKLQIFVEEDAVNFDPDQAFVDPVSKFRVSNPENLIDTDFEYGLQSTKWETLELVKNIPTFFARNGDEAFPLNNLESSNGSDIITVTTDIDHDLLVGSPIIVAGSKSITADGAFVVTTVLSNRVFLFKSKAAQNFTGSIKDDYTQVFPGSVYQGTEFDLSGVGAIITDSEPNSTLTVTTKYPTLFSPGTSFFLTNSISKVNISFEAALIQTSNFNSILRVSVNNNETDEVNTFSLGAVQPYDYTGQEAIYFRPSDITIDNNDLTFSFPHGITDNTTWLYVIGEGNTGIGGITNYTGYYVRVVNANTIYFTNLLNGTTKVSLTSVGTNVGIMRSALLRGIRASSANTGNSSIVFQENHGLSNNDNTPLLFFHGVMSNLIVNTNLLNVSTASIYYARTVIANNAVTFTNSPGGSQIGLSSSSANGVMVKASLLDSANSIYFFSHQLTTDDIIEFTTLTGITPGGLTSGLYYKAEIVNSNRIRFKDNQSGAVINLTTFGSVTGEYRIQARIPNLNNDAIFLPNNSLLDGAEVEYNDLGKTPIGGLNTGQRYFIFQKTRDFFKLATTISGWATTAIPLTSITLNTDIITTQINHGFTNATLVQYLSATPMGGLTNGAFYWVRVTSPNTCSLHWTREGALNGSEIIDITTTLTGTHTLRQSTVVDLTSAGVGEQRFTVTQVGASDGVYNLLFNEDDRTFKVRAGIQIVPRDLIISGKLDFTNGSFYVIRHSFTTGTPVVYRTTDTAISNLIDGETYYIIRISRDWFRLAISSEEAFLGNAIAYNSRGSGTHTIESSNIVGEVPGSGTVTTVEGSNIITGFVTNFTAIYSPGDTFRLNVPEVLVVRSVSVVDVATNILTSNGHGFSNGQSVRMASTTAPGGTVNGDIYFVRVSGLPQPANQFTLHFTQLEAIAGNNPVDITSTGSGVAVERITSLGQTLELRIRFVNSRTEIVTVDPIPVSVTGASYSISSSLYIRADGSALHRPYDGGVELIPSQNPDSQMIRQTRKYFRYQSGKGIQVSFAVNFSPTTSFDALSVFQDNSKVNKCRRDIGYLIDGVGYDIVFGTNYNAIFLGLAESNSLDLSNKVKEIIANTKTTLLAIPEIDNVALASSRTASFFDEILNIVNVGRNAASPIVFPNPVGASSGAIAAKDRLLSNLTFIEEEINAWVALNFPNYDHDVSKCTRDIKYAVWGLCYDILYGGNSATLDSAAFFNYASANGDFGIIPSHIEQTVSAYVRLGVIVSDIVLGTLITRSPGNTIIQDRTGNNATSTEATALQSLVSIIEDTIETQSVPSLVKILPDVSQQASELVLAKTTIDTNKSSIVLTVVPSSIAFLTGQGRTRFPHRMAVGSKIFIYGSTGADADIWNGSKRVTEIPDQYTFRFSLDQIPSESEARGLSEYYLEEWQNSRLKCGLFDDQNGLYFEYDGKELFCCRRSSVQQISGTAIVTFKSSQVVGVGTKFSSQLVAGDKIVIKGQTYLISKIESNTLLFVLPSYRGESSQNVIITKTIDTKVPQRDWSIDPCFGTGPTGFVLDINKIQMAYMDYSWYGAGKVRFGFKDQTGLVTYTHEFIHNNKFTEAYMRSGNLPARYEIENIGRPSYVPALAHWGTSVIMDGRFDDDKSYVFTAGSNTITVTGSATANVTARVETRDFYQINAGGNQFRFAGHALRVDTPSAVLNNIGANVAITGANLQPGTLTSLPFDSRITPRQPYLPGVSTIFASSLGTLDTRNLILINRQPTGTATTSSAYTVVLSATPRPVVFDIPLITIRLAPSVDNSSPGFLGQREIINRMQLILNQVGILTTHAAEITLKLNAQLNNNSWQRVQNPSLSQLIYHQPDDSITGGTIIFSFRAQGSSGTTGRTQVNTVQELGDIATLGNSIMGGDGTFPDGPDVLTIVARLVEDPSTVSLTNPFNVAGRISWSESQA
jgi:hypothetical protein